VPEEDLECWLAAERNWFAMSVSVSQERIREELTKMFKHDTVDTLEFLYHCSSSEAIKILFDKCGIWLKPTTEKK